jgi:hypothetical protein
LKRREMHLKRIKEMTSSIGTFIPIHPLDNKPPEGKTFIENRKKLRQEIQKGSLSPLM